MPPRSRYYNEEGPPLFAHLDDIVTILGGTKLSFWPLLAALGDTNTSNNLPPYGAGVTAQVASLANAAGNVAFSVFGALQHPGGILSVNTSIQTNGHIKAAADHANHSFGNATVDTPFSAGVWIQPLEALGTARSLMAKYRSTAVAAREYDFRFDTSGNLILELFDESATASEIGTGASDVIVPFAWNFCVATYDGGETAPVVHLYRNGVDQLASGATTETGAYVAMEDTATPLLMAARDLTASPAQIFQGRIALPFITGKALTAAEVASLYSIGQQLIGLS